MANVPKRATMTELVGIASLSHVSLRKHIRQANILKGKKDKKYNVQRVLTAIEIHRELNKNQPATGPFSKARTAKVLLQCSILQAKLDEARRQSVPIAEVISLIDEVFGGLRKVLMALPASEAPRLSKAKTKQAARTILQNSLTRTLNAYARVYERRSRQITQ